MQPHLCIFNVRNGSRKPQSHTFHQNRMPVKGIPDALAMGIEQLGVEVRNGVRSELGRTISAPKMPRFYPGIPWALYADPPSRAGGTCARKKEDLIKKKKVIRSGLRPRSWVAFFPSPHGPRLYEVRSAFCWEVRISSGAAAAMCNSVRRTGPAQHLY